MNNLELTGRLFKVLPEQSGTSKSGKEWKKKDFCIETEEQYSKRVCFTLFGEKVSYIDKFTLGDMLDVKFNVESNEGTNNKWFHNVNAYNVQKTTESGSNQTTGNQDNYSSAIINPNDISIKDQIMAQKSNEPESESDDLPF